MEESGISDYNPQFTNYPMSFVGRCANKHNYYEMNNSFASHSKRHHYYNLENIKSSQNFFCEMCNKGFYNQGQYQKHIDGHIKCPFPECDVWASLKALDQHIDNQHIMVKFESLQIDNESWLNERKKRFPTAQRAELRRVIQLEKSKRGERLGKDKKKFQKYSGNHKYSGSVSNYKPSSTNNLTKKENFKLQRPNHSRYPIELEDLDDSDSDVKFGIPAFKGTRAFLESTGELSQFGLQQTNSQDEINIDISDDEEWNELASDNAENKTVLHNALGTLIGAYESGEDSDTEVPNKKITISNTEAVDIVSEVHLSSDKSIHSQSSFHNSRNHNQQKRKLGNKAEKSIPTCKKKFNGFKRRRPTLLQRLLAPEIVHERNVLLQCIRYIVENNYFSSPNNKIVDTCMNDSEELKKI